MKTLNCACNHAPNDWRLALCVHVPCADVRWMCRVYFHVVRDGGAKEQLAGKKGFPTDELLQFYGCVLVYHSCLSPWYVALQHWSLSQPGGRRKMPPNPA